MVPSIDSGIKIEPVAGISCRRPALRTVERVAAVVIFASLSAALALYAFYYLFSTFQDYDDVGYILITLKQFMQGHALYDDLFSQYGPFFYWNHWLPFRLGLPVSHDAAGFLTLVYWISGSLLFAIFIYRVTGNLVASLFAEVSAVMGLFMLSYEAGHPQALCVWLLALVLASASAWSERRRNAIAFSLGILLGSLVLTKVNVGVYALIAVALTVTAVIPGRSAAALTVAAGLAALILPAALMRGHLGQPWARSYALIVTLSLIPILAIQWRHGSPLPRLLGRADGARSVAGEWLKVRDGLILFAGFVVSLVVITALTLARGTSVHGLLDGVLLQHVNFPSIFFLPMSLDGADTIPAWIGVAAYFVTAALASTHADGTWFQWLLAAAKLAFATLVFALTYTAFAIDPWGARRHAELLATALPFAWLGAISVRAPCCPGHALARRLLIALAGMQALVAYPVAGTQVCLSTCLLDVIAGVCLADALGVVVAILPDRIRESGPHLAIDCATAALIMGLVAYKGRSIERLYSNTMPLDLPGARWCRADLPHVALYRWLAVNLDRQSDTFITEPGLNSLYLWTEKDPPTALNTTHWMTMFSPARQAQIVDQLASRSRLCAVRQNRLAAHWLHSGQTIASLPLVRYIDEEFATAGIFAGYEFRVRRFRPVPEMTSCIAPPLEPRFPGRDMPAWEPWLLLPAMPGRDLARIAIYDTRFKRAIADTAPKTDELPIQVTADGAEKRDLTANPLDLTRETRLQLHIARADLLPPNVPLLARLSDSAGHVFEVVPVLESH